MAMRRATVVLKRSKMKPVGKVMKLFMKDAKVKMSENLSSWALQSGGETGRAQEPGVEGANLCSTLDFLPDGHPAWLPSGAAPDASDSLPLESSPLGEPKCDCP